MGQERECRMQYRGREFKGKAYLETDFLLFRGDERLKLPFKEMTTVHAGDGLLRLEFGGAEVSFDLGTAAAKWADKILHPPSRLDKLGVKPGASVALVGEFDADFVDELRAAQATVVAGSGSASLLFLAANGQRDLARIPKLAERLMPGSALWVVYPKGNPEVREIEVIQASRGAGLKDTKVAAFSSTRTALRFSPPAR